MKRTEYITDAHVMCFDCTWTPSGDELVFRDGRPPIPIESHVARTGHRVGLEMKYTVMFEPGDFARALRALLGVST